MGLKNFEKMGKKRVITKRIEGSRDKEVTSAALRKKATKRTVLKGAVYIAASYNNTFITITDTAGGVIAWSSAGSAGFSGTRKSTPYAATTAARIAGEKAKLFGLRQATAYVKGVGPGREAAIRGIASLGIDIDAIVDITPIPHNGATPPKPRRV